MKALGFTILVLSAVGLCFFFPHPGGAHILGATVLIVLALLFVTSRKP